MINQEKALEYQQMAALTCIGIDLLADIAETKGITRQELREQIKLLKEDKDTWINNPKERQKRYAAGSFIFNAVAQKE